MTARTTTAQTDSRPTLEVISHDFIHALNNALTPILVYTELMLRQPQDMADPATMTRRLETMRTSARDAARLIRNLREFCKYSLFLEDSPDPNPSPAKPRPEAHVHMFTEMRQAGIRWQHLLAASPAVLYCCQPAGHRALTQVTANVAEHLGLQVADVVGNSRFWSERLHPDDQMHMAAALRQLPDREQLVVEYRLLHQDGEYRRVRDHLKLARDAAGRPAEIIGCWLDVTEPIAQAA